MGHETQTNRHDIHMLPVQDGPGKFNMILQCNSSFTKIKVQSLYNPNFGSIGMDHVISELCYIETILQRNYRKMTIS